jgi:hypothetical protein
VFNATTLAHLGSFAGGGVVSGVEIAPDRSEAWASSHRFQGFGLPGALYSDALIRFDPSNPTSPFVQADAFPIGDGSDGPGRVAGLFPGGSPPPSAAAPPFVLPSSVNLVLNGVPKSSSGRESLTVAGTFDVGAGPVDWSAQVTFEAGGLSKTVAPAPNGNASEFSFKDEEFSLTLRPGAGGSSRGSFKAKFVGPALGGGLSLDGPLTLRLKGEGLFDAVGAVTLVGGRFSLKRSPGALVEPTFFPATIRAKPSDARPDVLVLRAGFPAPDATPTALGAVRIGVGTEFELNADGSVFERSGDRYRMSSKQDGAKTSIVLDFRRGTVLVKAKGVEIGSLAEPITELLFDAGDGRGETRVRIALASRGTKRVY